MLKEEIKMVRRQTESGVSIGIRKTITSLQNGTKLIEMTKPAEFTIKIANTLEEREAVFNLGYKIYLEKGFVGENPQEWLVRNYDATSETVILIVQDKEKNIVGSVTLVFAGDCSLPAEKMYREEIKALQDNGRKLVEISRLVINPDYRNSKEILLLLFNYLAIYCFHVKNYTCLTVQVNPRHQSYYKALLGFEEIGGEKASPHLKNAPAVLLHLPLSFYQSEVKRLAGTQDQNKKERSLYPHFLKLDQEKLVAHYLQKQVKPISQEEKTYFGFTDSNIGKALCV